MTARLVALIIVTAITMAAAQANARAGADSNSGSGSGSGPEQRDGLNTLNRIRQSTGLPPLHWDPALLDAAADHASYLRRNHERNRSPSDATAHNQTPGNPGFSGEFAAERATARGYPHTEVGENISSGDSSFSQSIDGLMGAIYHRFGFLSFAFDQIGLARADQHFVYVLGRRNLSTLCLRPPDSALAVPPVNCAGTRVTAHWFDRLCRELPDAAYFRAPWPTVCGNGQLLDADYMTRFCRRPPANAQLRGSGRYYTLCNDRFKIRADWFDRFCRRPPAGASYDWDGRYYEQCTPTVRIHADWLRDTCAAAPPSGRYRDSGRYGLPCTDPNIKLRVETLDELKQEAQLRGPDTLLWPPPDSVDVPPAFFDEDPDPLPDREVSGYPVSIQFNPATTQRVTVTRFELYKQTGSNWRRVSPTRLLSAANDPNDKLTSLQFALFPLRRLQWGGHYQARVRLQRDGERENIRWEFTIRDPGHPLLTVTRRGQRFRVGKHARPVLYAAPRGNSGASVDRLHIGYFEPTRVSSEAVDGNTARLNIHWGNCRPVTVKFSDGRSARIEREDCR